MVAADSMSGRSESLTSACSGRPLERAPLTPSVGQSIDERRIVMGPTQRGETVRRRALIGFVCTAFVAWPSVGRAQQPAKVARLGFLGFGDPKPAATRVEALREGLRDLGYVEGKN